MRRGTGNVRQETNLVMREFIDGETVDGFLLALEPVGKDIGECEGNKEDQGQYVY